VRKIILALTCMLFLAPTAQGEDISISAHAAPQQASVGESIRLEVLIEGKANLNGTPTLPELPDFQVYGGGRSSNFMFVNGQVSSTLQFTYMLVPKRAGKFTIGPITINHNNKTYSTAPIPVEVGGGTGGAGGVGGTLPPAAVAPSVPSQAAPAAPSAPAPGSGRPAGEAVFIATQVDKREVYVNQPVTLTFRFYSRISILSQPQYQPPDTSGFWAEDLPPQRDYVTQVNGYDYRVIEIKTALFPTTAGKLTIGPATLTVQVEDFNRRSADPFADNFFRSFFSGGKQVSLRSEPIALNVKPVPQDGRPGDFSGTVGQWSMSAKLDRKEAKVGEAVTLEVRIFGEGNVKSVGKPQFPPFTGFRVYDTISSSEVQKQEGRVHGVKTYRTLLRPEITGTLTLPSIRYVYFNPRSAKFEQVEVPGLNLKVLPGESASAMPPVAAGTLAAPQPSGPDVKMMNRDVRYLKTRVPLTPPSKPWPPLFWLLGFGLPPLGLLIAWRRQRHQDQLAADPVYARRLTAARSAWLALRQARTARQKKDTAVFYASLSQALCGYLADQLGLSRASVTQRELLRRLAAAGASAQSQTQLAGLLDECDYARFAPSGREAADLERHEREAEALLTELGHVLGKEKKA